MKSRSIAVSCGMVVLVGILTPYPSRAAVLSAPTNGVYLAIGGWTHNIPKLEPGAVTNQIIRFDDTLVFMPFCDTGKVELAYPKPEYGIRLRMLSRDGTEVPKTPLGAKFGSKFGKLKSFTDNRLGIIDAWGPYTENPDLGGGRLLPRPEDLFRMRDTGIYILTIEIEMFHRADPKDTDKYWTPFRLPPVSISVEKVKVAQNPNRN